MIALILGGASSVWDEHAAAEDLLCRGHLVVAANLAGIHYPGRLDAWATLHPELLPGWAAQRKGNSDFRSFTPDDVAERWSGSSGLYAAQVALSIGTPQRITPEAPISNSAT